MKWNEIKQEKSLFDYPISINVSYIEMQTSLLYFTSQFNVFSYILYTKNLCRKAKMRYKKLFN